MAHHDEIGLEIDTRFEKRTIALSHAQLSAAYDRRRPGNITITEEINIMAISDQTVDDLSPYVVVASALVVVVPIADIKNLHGVERFILRFHDLFSLSYLFPHTDQNVNCSPGLSVTRLSTSVVIGDLFALNAWLGAEMPRRSCGLALIF